MAYNGYEKAGILSMTRTFYIPIYQNMKDEISISVVDATENSVSISWNKIENATNYQVQYQDVYGNWIDYAFTADTAITFANLQPASLFAVRIRAFTQKGRKHRGVTFSKSMLPQSQVKFQI